MSIISIPFTFSAGAVIIASQHNTNFTTIYSDYNGNIDNTNIVSNAAISYSKLSLTGNIVNADINASAAIVDTKLATISTTGKVNISALTVASQAQGDIVYASSATAWTRLGPGTSGQFLKTQGAAANPIWATPALTFISNTTISGAADTGDIAITSSGYYKVFFQLGNLSAADTISIRINNDTASNYAYVFNGRTTGGALTGGSASATSIIVGTSIKNTALNAGNGELFITPAFGNSPNLHSLEGKMSYIDNAGNLYSFVDFMGSYNNGPGTSFRISTSGGATMSGTVLVYKFTTS